jgi:ADP-ribose pyrophosphatase YjhB (NUDIX family)
MLRLMLLTSLSVATAAAAHAQTQPNPSFNLINRGGQPIVHLYANPAGFPNWGQDRLSGATVAPGARFPVRLLANGNCIYDVRVAYADGRTEDRRNIDTCKQEDVAFGGNQAVAGATPAKDDPSFRLVNRGHEPVRELYAMPAGMTNWGPNRLGAEALPAGAYRIIRLPKDGNCVLDVRAVFADGAAAEKRRINTCETVDLPVP